MTADGNQLDIAAQAEDWGSLVAVLGCREVGSEDDGDNPRYDEFVFRFERGTITVTAMPDDDTVRLSNQGPTLPHRRDLTAIEPWDRLVGSGVLWMWTLTNQKGYQDGFQLELGRPGFVWSLQLTCEASSLSAQALTSLESLTNLLAH